MVLLRTLLFMVVFALSLTPAFATDFKPIVVDRTYHHDKYGTKPRDIIRKFRAYITSFDSADDDDGDGIADRRGIPEWVAYEMRAHPRKLRRGPKRPSKWITDQALYKAHIAPSDDTYAYSRTFRKRNTNWYARGHLCAKIHAWRLGAAADWNTHTVLNAVPQRQFFNAGIWKDLENKTAAWADEFGVVWIIDGPIFNNHKPSRWLGEKGEVKAAIPDALFKIVIKKSEKPHRPDVLAFVYSQECDDCKSQRGPFDQRKYLTSVHHIEVLTGLDFFTSLSNEDQNAIEATPADEIWR